MYYNIGVRTLQRPCPTFVFVSMFPRSFLIFVSLLFLLVLFYGIPSAHSSEEKTSETPKNSQPAGSQLGRLKPGNRWCFLSPSWSRRPPPRDLAQIFMCMSRVCECVWRRGEMSTPEEEKRQPVWRSSSWCTWLGPRELSFAPKEEVAAAAVG